jgi:hypothetical protein
LIAAFREIIPALLKQSKDKDYFVLREIPQSQPHSEVSKAEGGVMTVDGGDYA